MPVFLKHIAHDVYVCGKTINLLKLCCPRVSGAGAREEAVGSRSVQGVVFSDMSPHWGTLLSLLLQARLGPACGISGQRRPAAGTEGGPVRDVPSRLGRLAVCCHQGCRCPGQRSESFLETRAFGCPPLTLETQRKSWVLVPCAAMGPCSLQAPSGSTTSAGLMSLFLASP